MITYNCLIPVDALHFYDGTGICHVLLVIHLALRSIAYNYYTVCMKATSLEKVVQTESKSFSNFQYSNIKSNSGMQWFCFTTVCDWSTKLAPSFRPIWVAKLNQSQIVHSCFPTRNFVYMNCIWYEFPVATSHIFFRIEFCNTQTVF